ncbi:MAG: hypothetical protein M1562_01585 [Candidatus Marsarchaeota archaeon]|jgi:translation elongation factor EF-1beta|nr:hypothetical protein [Candidatus Marsarchaeota archaeon]
MSKAAILFRVYPKDGLLNAAVEDIKRNMKPSDIKLEEVGFGIKIIKVLFTYDTAVSGSSEIEERLRGLDNVEEVEVEQDTLL